MDTKKRVELFIKKFGFEPEAYEVCPKWDYCSCNKCPLHKDYSKLQIEPSDKQRKCKSPKQVRKQIGLYFKLKNMGLSLRELNSMKQSIRMKEEFKFTQGKNLKTSQTTLTDTSSLSSKDFISEKETSKNTILDNPSSNQTKNGEREE